MSTEPSRDSSSDDTVRYRKGYLSIKGKVAIGLIATVLSGSCTVALSQWNKTQNKLTDTQTRLDSLIATTQGLYVVRNMEIKAMEDRLRVMDQGINRGFEEVRGDIRDLRNELLRGRGSPEKP